MKVFFLVQCHKLTTPLTYNILKLSKIKDVKIFIHVDKKSDINQFIHLEGPNIIFIKKRIDVHWGGQAQINVSLNLFKEIIHLDYDYVSFISGDDLFYRSFSDFKSFLLNNNGKEFIGIDSSSEQSFQQRFKMRYPSIYFDRYLPLWLRISKKAYSTCYKFGFFQNKTPAPFTRFYKGSNWFTLSKLSIDYIFTTIEKNSDIMKFFQNSFCCDEIIFQTILMNSEFKNSIYKIFDDDYDDNRMSLRYIDWKSGPEYPKILHKKELQKEFPLDSFFIRKVDSQIPLDFIVNTFDIE
ncbi:beta-1,6-N-acetylglucosaminyltransferase [Pseudocolwellia sp. HL-MZ7]|uniref:beta-1,6-N-acetylglucosaminyltransferase n=1 Tax=Pseudocolwellia sp. HL-MZ7 TaxID=3400627 RepID=UPI003CF96FB2